MNCKTSKWTNSQNCFVNSAKNVFLVGWPRSNSKMKFNSVKSKTLFLNFLWLILSVENYRNLKFPSFCFNIWCLFSFFDVVKKCNVFGDVLGPNGPNFCNGVIQIRLTKYCVFCFSRNVFPDSISISPLPHAIVGPFPSI